MIAIVIAFVLGLIAGSVGMLAIGLALVSGGDAPEPGKDSET